MSVSMLNETDPRVALLRAPMSVFQKIAVALTVCLCTLDGFDVMAITFAAPAIRTAWSVNQAQLGLVLSSGLLGMAIGSLLIAPAADLLGRRCMIFLSLVLMIGGDLRSSATHTVADLMLARVVTGLGIGAMIAVISSLAAEYANARRRDFCLTLMGAGFPVGGLLGGLLAADLLPTYGCWRAPFQPISASAAPGWSSASAVSAAH
jgi:MFS transporter, AAHS family, 4-hydroxybenzoate transporter